METKISWLLKTPIAHRGLHNFEFPENSMPAFVNAVEHGFAIELDVRLIDDQSVIVFHDDKLSRMTNMDGYVSNLKASDLDEIKLAKSEYGIPTFEKVLETVNGKVPLLIEIKKAEQSFAIEDKVIDMLKSYDGPYAVQSFDPTSMQYFGKNAPNIMRGQLSSYFLRSDKSHSRREKSRMKKLKYNSLSHPDFISYNFNNLPNKYVTATGLPVLAWTIRSELEAAKAQSVCDNIIFEGFMPKLPDETPEIQ